MEKELSKNKEAFLALLGESADIKKKTMQLGIKKDVGCFIAYIEVTGGSFMFENSVVGKLLNQFCGMSGDEIRKSLSVNALGISDMTLFDTIEEAAGGMFAGDVILFVDGLDQAVKIPDKGYPAMSLQTPDSEKVIRGSKEGFMDSIKVNSALIRKRLRTPKLKVEEVKVGTRTATNVDLVYMEDLVYPGLLKEVKRRLGRYEIDGILDSGMIEQLSEEKWYSPFPQFQTTQRPDRAAMSILEGRIVVLVDNSPTGLILPTDYNSFIKTSDDMYNRWEIASFGRLLRYMAAFFAMTVPGIYLAVTNFHTQVLPTTLLLSFAAARQGVPFPAVVEVILMEIAFELLREAGVRLPGAMGNTIGIVGGLIIGQAAVEANIVSPIVVIVVAFTALCSFAIPNEEFATSFRLLKFLFIFLCSWLGFYGFLYGIMLTLIHLSHLKSFGIPYLMPFVGADLNQYDDERDSLIRQPLFLMRRRPIYARRNQRIRLRRKDRDVFSK